MLADLRIALRALLKARGFTASVVLTLGLAMALCVTALLVVNAYVLRGLPYPAASRLYAIRYAPPGQPAPRGLESLDWHALDDLVEHQIAWDLDMFYLIGGSHAETARGAWVTPGFMQALGIAPAIGRAFDAEAFRAGSPQVALISHALWQRRFAGDPAIVGRRFDAYVSDRPDEAEGFTIAGVLPPDFWHVNPYTDVIAPLRARTYPYMVRLRDGVPPGAVAARLGTLMREASATGAQAQTPQPTLVAVHEQYIERVRPVLRAVSLAAALVLLVACANVAALLLIRATRRTREIAVRMALGAGRAGIARLVAAEALLLAAGATLVGIAASAAAARALAPTIQRELGRPAPGGAAAFGFDGTAAALAAAAGLAAAVGCAMFPVMACWRSNLLQAVQHESRTATEGRRSRRMRSILIVLEVAASLALLAGSALMVQSVVRMLRVDLGIRAERVLTAPITLRQRTYPDAATRLAFYERALARLNAMPGVEAASLSDFWPLQQPRPEPIALETRTGRAEAQAGVVSVSAGYLNMMGVPMRAGRDFTSADRLGTEPVAMVSHTLARLLRSDGHALGARVLVRDASQNDEDAPVARTVVGIVADVRQGQADENFADVYVPLMQAAARFARINVRTAGPPMTQLAQVRQTFSEIDPDIALTPARPLQEIVDEQFARPKFLASLLGAFALVAALMALVGVYGVIAYSVRQREREIAVRMAIGADPRRITGLFLRQGGAVLAAGLAIGVVAAAGAGRLLESQLFGMQPGDPLSLAATAAAFGAAGIAAVWWPARRAAAINPATVLNET